MAVLDIVKDENILSIVCTKANYKESSPVVKDLLDTARDHSDNCYGLAANQIGYSVRIIAVRTPKDDFQIILNPIIINHSNSKHISEEYCLSWPGIKKTADRWDWVEVMYELPNGKRKKERFSGIRSVIIQHEMDHLAGKLI